MLFGWILSYYIVDRCLIGYDMCVCCMSLGWFVVFEVKYSSVVLDVGVGLFGLKFVGVWGDLLKWVQLVGMVFLMLMCRIVWFRLLMWLVRVFSVIMVCVCLCLMWQVRFVVDRRVEVGIDIVLSFVIVSIIFYSLIVLFSIMIMWFLCWMLRLCSYVVIWLDCVDSLLQVYDCRFRLVLMICIVG